MSKTSIFLFRSLLVLGGILLIYIIGKPMVETVQSRFVGESVKGRIIGFRSRGSSKFINEENTGKKHRSRRPVYRHPKTDGSLDSLDGFSSSTILHPWFNFELNEKVTVVFQTDKPEKSHIFSISSLLSDFVLLFLCLYMVKLGVPKRS